MGIAPERVREIFRGLETGDGAAFFRHVADDATAKNGMPFDNRYCWSSTSRVT
jgi:hypothetical protein